MARFADREKARILRAEGKSYSEIKQVLNVSKGTLSVWLNDMPLSLEQIRLLRDLNPRRIENFRKTMRYKRELRLQKASKQVKQDVGNLTQRDIFIGGLYLYWGEGMKSKRGTVGIANTDPGVIMAFLNWMKYMRVPIEKIHVRLHLYSDMNIKRETSYWVAVLGISREQFRKPYIKTSKLSGLTYKNGYGHGTCNLLFENIAFWEYITMALRHIRESYMRP